MITEGDSIVKKIVFVSIVVCSIAFSQENASATVGVVSKNMSVEEYISMGRLYFEKNEYDSSITYLELALKGANSPRHVNAKIQTFFYLSQAYREKGWLDSKYFDLSLNYIDIVKQTILSKKNYNSVKLDSIYNYYTHLYIDMGRLENAMDSGRKCKLNSKKSDELILGYIYYGRAHVLSQRLFLYDVSNDFFLKSAQIFLKYKLWLKAIQAYKRVADNLMESGNYYEAIKYLHKGLTLSIDKTLLNSKYKRIVGEVLANLGVAYAKKGDLKNSNLYLNKALQLWTNDFKGELGYREYTAMCYLGIVENHIELSEYKKALQFLTSAESLIYKYFDESHELYWIYNTYKGRYYSSISAPKLAMSYFRKNIDWFEKQTKVNASIRLHKGKNYILLGGEYFNVGSYHEAITCYRNALKSYIYINNDFGTAESFMSLGNTYEKLGDVNNALIHYQKSLQALTSEDYNISEIQFNPSPDHAILNKLIVKVLIKKANVLKKLNTQNRQDINKISLETLLVAADFVDLIRKGYMSTASKYSLAEEAHQIHEEGINIALQLYEDTNDKIYLDKAFIFTENTKNVVLEDAIFENAAKAFANVPDSLLSLEKSIKIDITFYRNRLQKLLQAKNEKHQHSIRIYQNHIFELQTKYEALILRLEKQYTRYFELKYKNKSVTLKDLQKTLDAKTAIVEYFVGRNTLFVFIITNEDYNVVDISVGSNFKQICQSFNNSLLKNSERSHFVSNSFELYNLLVKPLRPYLTQKENLVFIPDDYLNQITFSCLVTELPSDTSKTHDYTSLNYLVKQFNISYHLSSNFYYFQKSKPYDTNHKIAGFLGVAPIFSTNSTDNRNTTLLNLFKWGNSKPFSHNQNKNNYYFRPLPNTKTEVSNILEIFRDKRINGIALLNKDASESSFKTISSDYRYIHLATHSFVNHDQPELSGIAFSESSQKLQDGEGILYASEIFNLNLNADLVVLSSCESGAGKLVKGEGMLAMSRGFLYAGAKNLIASLWKVADSPSSMVMSQLYKDALNGGTFAEALRKAQLKMLENAETAFPRIWSSYIMIGQ